MSREVPIDPVDLCLRFCDGASPLTIAALVESQSLDLDSVVADSTRDGVRAIVDAARADRQAKVDAEAKTRKGA